MIQELGNEEVTWDLTHLYRDMNDPDINRDIETIKNKIRLFSKEYRGKLGGITPHGLNKAITDIENIAQSAKRLTSFAYLNFSTRTGDPEAGAFLQKQEEIASQFGKEMVFFDLEWASIEDEKANSLLEDPVMSKYRHYLTQLRKYRPHLLSETEEKLLQEISPVGAGSWNRLFEKVISQARFGGRVEEEVLAELYYPDRQVRIKAAKDVTEGLTSQQHILTHIFNTILADRMIKDRLRKFPDWVSYMNLDNEIDEKTVNALVDAVKSRYDIPQRYYRKKRELLGYDELFDYDRYAPLPQSSEKKKSWHEGREIVLDAYNAFSPEMKNIALKFFEGRWIHAPIMPGKIGGAFSHPTTPDVHPYIMLNYSGNRRDVQTLAHELGHGIHQYLSGSQGYFNSQTPLVTSEVASVFGEMLVFRSLLDKIVGRNEKLNLLSVKLEEIFATVFRQIAMNRFEDAVHRERRSLGELSPERFGKHWIDTQKEMFGNSLTLTEDYSVWWSYIPHFLQAPGYVYSYAFAELLVLSLYKMFTEEGDSFIPKYLDLLSSGGRESPPRLLEEFGISLDDPGFWYEGLDIIDDMLKQMEELV
ncbi:Peptidase family M3 [uncultured archaeon]|nr:Peptidase family M3 [uncultured archaeon]